MSTTFVAYRLPLFFSSPAASTKSLIYYPITTLMPLWTLTERFLLFNRSFHDFTLQVNAPHRRALLSRHHICIGD